MSEPEKWSMPVPPPAHVRTVRDADGHELWRYSKDGTMWMDYGDGPAVSWDSLVYNRGPITADESY